MNWRSRRRILAALVLTAVAAVVTTSTAEAERVAPAPLLGLGTPNVIPDRYIVVLSDAAPTGALAAVGAQAVKAGGSVHFEYSEAITGFAATLPAPALANLRADPAVVLIEADQTIKLEATQSPATWGLDRIDQRALPLSNSYTYTFDGSGVKAYIIDTGIRFGHADFGGQAVSGYDAVDGGSADDCNGHGTHVAGTVGGTTWGVAKNVALVGVRVLNCQGSGTTSGVIAGVDWVTGNHQAGEPAVANMSLGGGASTALDNAVVNSINDGITYAVAAGNSNTNACNSSPARAGAAVTVGATTSSDARSSFSNFGTCLDLFAPGSSITSAWSTSNTATNTISGTSMAAPHVAGAAALLLDEDGSRTPAAVRDTIVATATTGVVGNAGSGSPNLLLFTGGGSAPPPPPPPPPPSGCGGLPEQYSGSLSGSGDSDHHPNGTYFSTSVSGTHRGCLDGPSGVDFDLYLRKWNGWTWATVASATGSGPDESVTYNGTAGYYTWRVVSYAGGGAYAFGMQRP